MRVLIAVDSSPHADIVVQAASRLLRRANRPAIRLVSVVGSSEGTDRPRDFPSGVVWAHPGLITRSPGIESRPERTRPIDQVRGEVQQHLAHLADLHLASYNPEIVVDVAEQAEGAIRSAAEDFAADLLITGTHGHTGLRRLVLGSVAQAVAHRSSVPTMLVREAADHGDPGAPVRLLLPTDGTQRVSDAVPRVGALAGSLRAGVTVIQAIEPHSLVIEATREPQHRAAERHVGQLVAALTEAGARSEGFAVEGSAARTLAREAQERDIELVVVPTHGRSEAGRIVFGSVAEQLIHEAPCPVAVLTTPGS